MANVKTNFAFSLSFSVVSETGNYEDISPEVMRQAILVRLAGLCDNELLEAIGMPWDDYVEEVE